MPLARIFTDGESEQKAFVSLERTAFVPAELRKALPRLRNELSKKWSIRNVEIEIRTARRKNPYDLAQVATDAAVGLAITFSLAALKAAGNKVGEGVGQEIVKHVRRWIRNFAKSRQDTRHRGSSRERKLKSRKSK